VYLGVLRETAPGERRVALVPEIAAQLVQAGHRVGVVAGAGEGAGLADAAYATQGAEVVADPDDLVHRSDVLLAVRLPDSAILRRARPGTVLVGLLAPLLQPARMQELAAAGITAFSLDAIPRVTRAQSMDVLSSMSTVAGYRAVILAALLAQRFFPMLMSAAGTVAPAKVLVIGAGVAGLQAIATARRLGAVVQGFDARPGVKEQVESLGAVFLSLPEVELQGGGGYARAVAAEEEARERAFLAAPVRAADVVITTAMVPGARAPLLIDEDMVASMRPGSVIVDLAAEAGGNSAVTVPGERVVSHGVIVEGATDLPSQMALPASQLFSRNLLNYLRYLLDHGLEPGAEGEPPRPRPTEDEIVRATCITRDGEVVHDATVARLGSLSSHVRSAT
jgi:NAD(P) transhydrogenase subunit alpha